MTKREPFARIIEFKPGRGPDKCRVVACGKFIQDFEYMVEAKNLRDNINAAHEARIKEAVKKAVEEFRERAALLAVAWYCHDGYFISRKIRALPTEPEGK